jgi:hypothetical protein
MVFYSFAGLLPQGSLYMYTSDPIQIGIIALPNGVAQVLCGGIATLFMGKVGHLKLQVIVCLIFQTVFTAAYAGFIPMNRAAWSAFQFFSMGPFALITLLCYVIAGLNVPLRHLGIASGLIGTFRSGGGSVGNASKWSLSPTTVVRADRRKSSTRSSTALSKVKSPKGSPRLQRLTTCLPINWRL